MGYRMGVKLELCVAADTNIMSVGGAPRFLL
jgi:hypothetical protein